MRSKSLFQIFIGLAAVFLVFILTFSSFQDAGREPSILRAEQEIGKLKTAVESYFWHHNDIPREISDLYYARPAIIKEEVRDPFKTAGRTFAYTPYFGKDGVGNPIYLLSSCGPDGKLFTFRLRNEGTNQAYVALSKNADDIVVSNVPILRE